MQIVIAYVEETMQPVAGKYTTSRGDGVNAVPVLANTLRGRACMWLNDGTEEDVEKAKRYAASMDVLKSGVFCYAADDESDVLDKARRSIVRRAKAAGVNL